MKRIKIYVVICLMVLCFCGCQGKPVKMENEAKLDNEIRNNHGDEVLEECEQAKNDFTSEITIAVFGYADSLQLIVNEFNKTVQDYQVVIVDYSTVDNGENLFNTELLAGNYPDMFCFSELSPMPYIAKDYLLDLAPWLSTDEDLGQENLVLWDAFLENDQIFVVSPKFCIDTLSCVAEMYRNKKSWSFEDYFALEASLEDWQDIIYYITPEFFVEKMGERYIGSAINLDDVRCDFTDPMFLEILESSHRIRSSISQDHIKTGAQRMAENQLMACAEWIDSIDDISFERFRMGSDMKNYIGYPTPDGSSGSDAILITPVGICNQSSQKESCYSFIKYMIMHPVIDGDGSGIPVYLPAFEDEINRFNETNSNWIVEDKDAEVLLELANSCKNSCYSDEIIVNIIMEETETMFKDNINPKDVAKNIHDRVNLYLTEKYG